MGSYFSTETAADSVPASVEQVDKPAPRAKSAPSNKGRKRKTSSESKPSPKKSKISKKAKKSEEEEQKPADTKITTPPPTPKKPRTKTGTKPSVKAAPSVAKTSDQAPPVVKRGRGRPRKVDSTGNPTSKKSSKK